MRRTKIVATLGPASDTPEMILQLIHAGVNVFRFNFSHGTQEDHQRRYDMVRAAAKEANRAVAILMDLQGPKMRTGKLVNGEPIHLTAGNSFSITTRELVGDERGVSTTYDLLPADVRVGGSILLSDGLIELKVMRTTGTDVETEVVNGGELRENQGINLPGAQVSAPAVTKKDVDDLHFGLQMGADYVAISFVRSGRDVQRVKDLIRQGGRNTPVIAKLERPEALTALDDILHTADGVMVARGDLGVEMPPEQVPLYQKQIIEGANRAGIPVITATQMLESMIQNPRPTRAETTDVANAIIDGTDAVMLSGETAKGNYPLEAVKMMALIAETTELSGRHGEAGIILPETKVDSPLPPLAIGTAAAAMCKDLPIKAIVVFTQSGSTAHVVSQQRPVVPILAFTPSEAVYNRLALLWGVTPLIAEFSESMRLFEREVNTTLVGRDFVAPGDLVVMTGGHPISEHGVTNFLKIFPISETE